MKKKSIYILIAHCLLWFCVNAQSDFIKIRGRQFFDNEGQPFYPMHAVYFLDVIYPEALFQPGPPAMNPVSDPYINQYYIAPNAWYGSLTMNGKYESYLESGSLALIEKDFRKIKEMGFNGVRLSNSSWRYNLQYDDWENGWVDIFPQDFFLKTWPDKNHYRKDVVMLRRPYDQDPFLDRYLVLLDSVLGRASNAGINVLMDVSVFGIYNFPSAVDDLQELLRIYGNHFKENKTLMGYVIIQEPTYTDLPSHVKSDICEKVNLFYETLHNPSCDTNHLITIGMIDVQDVLEWDPAVLKVDFLMPHVYPFFRDYEQLNMEDGIKRVLGKLYWISKNYPIPWFIGETNILASDDAILPGQMQAPESLQKQFVDSFLEQVHNCSGSGFTYFAYQESGRHDVSGGPFYNDGSGILRMGNLTNENDNRYDKEFVTDIRNYFDNRPPPNAELCSKPDNYYDPYNAKRHSEDYFPPGTIPMIKGTVTDQNGSPIKNAVVTVYAFTGIRLHEDLNNPNKITGVKDNGYYTFTDADGKYSITPFSIDFPNSPDGGLQFIRWIQVSAVGTTKSECPHPDGWTWYSNPNDPNTQWLNLPPNVLTECGSTNGEINFVLNRNSDSYYTVIENQLVNAQNSTKHYSGRLKLKAQGQNIISSDGTANLSALDTVNLKDEFSSVAGSETHIHNTNVFDECIDFPSPARINHSTTFLKQKKSRISKELDLVFTHEPQDISIFPNPGTGKFMLKIQLNSSLNKEIEIFDIYSKRIFSMITVANNLEIDISSQSKGLYFVKVKSNKSSIVKQLIIQ
ncbi:MAG TPA: T9SS type A sorting domain-containing protein [Bacteroidia bacterium]|nr:T9SS type A sorting domain-containing protein [Bacteroidia bacterium]